MHIPHNMKDSLLLATSWAGTLFSLLTLQMIPILLSCVVSILAAINYYMQIKKNMCDKDED